MLDTMNPDQLVEMVQRADDFRRKHTARGREIVRRYLGNWYRNDSDCPPTPENLVAGYVTFMLPEVSFSEPGIKIGSRRPVSHKLIGDFIEMGFEGWLRDADFGAEHQDVCRDMLINFGVMKVGMEPRDTQFDGDTYSESEALKPFAIRRPPDMFGMDPHCETHKYARFMYDKYWKDLTELQSQSDRWDPEAVDQVTSMVDDGSGGVGGYGANLERAVNFGQTEERKRVLLVDIWIRETGELITLAMSGREVSNVILRRVKYKGPSTGPYEIFGAYTVPGDPYPISALQFVMEQFEEMQTHIAATSEAAATYKRFIMVDAANVDGQNALMTAQNGSVCPVRGLAGGQFQQVELGGPNPEQMAYIMQLRDRFDRVIGMSDAQRGRNSGVTATEASQTQANVDGRVAYLKKRVAVATRHVMERVGWYLFYNPLVVMDVSHTDPVSGTTFEGLYLGGVQDGQTVEWSQFDVQIVPESMSRTDDAKQLQHAMTLLQLAPQALQLMMTMPAINVRWIVNTLGEAMNIQNLMDLLFNAQVLAQIGQAQQQQAQFGGMGQPAQLPQDANPALAGAFGPRQLLAFPQANAPAGPIAGPAGMNPGMMGGGMGGGMMGGGPPSPGRVAQAGPQRPAMAQRSRAGAGAF
jgi:hypothetical protein